MSFATEINTLMNADSTINGLVDGIYFMNAPDNTPLTGEYLVFSYELIGDISSLDDYNEMDIYKLEIAAFSDNTLTLDSIIEAIRDYLDNYNATPFIDFRVISDDRGVEGDKEQYSNIIEYSIIYKN